MKLLEMTVEGFRNLQPCIFRPSEGVSVIWGDNAQGKTNLLEAVWLFCGQRSFRGSRDREMVALDGELAKLSARFFAQEREQTAELMIREKRTAKRGGVEIAPSRLAESFKAVVFSPEHLSLIKDGPEVRRRFLDVAIAQMRPGYTHTLISYQRAVAQRSALLRDASGHSDLYALVEMFEESIARCGEKLIRMRTSFVEALNRYAPEIYSGISGGREAFFLDYQAKSGKTYAEILKSLQENRAQDFKTGITSAGPHRDDLEILIGNLKARQFGSQGQQRSAVLTLKLSEAKVIEHDAGESPLLLLDDVMSELDPSRQDYILNHTGGSQILITCCDPAETLRLQAGKLFHMEQGRLAEV